MKNRIIIKWFYVRGWQVKVKVFLNEENEMEDSQTIEAYYSGTYYEFPDNLNEALDEEIDKWASELELA